MLSIFYTLCVILGVLAVTYPKEFPMLMRNPEMFAQVVALETRRRWMMLKLWPMLYFAKYRMRFSLWRMQRIIRADLEKQKQLKVNNID